MPTLSLTQITQMLKAQRDFLQRMSYWRPNPRRYGSRSKYIPAGPSANVRGNP